MERTDHVFISHTSRDDEIAQRVHDVLEAAGINSWLDQIDVQPGDEWHSKIDEALRTASSVLVLLSNAATNSPTVTAEYRTFLAQNKALYVALIEPLSENEIPKVGSGFGDF